MKDLAIADLFCGAGGTSAGAVEAIRALGFEPKLTAINHWDVAIATHTANHPDARHLCTSLDNVNPRHLFGDGELDLLWASPECTHHSQARGGKPISDQSRATAWCVTRWAEACRPPVVLVENVPEFETWGPLDSRARPVQSKKGQLFHAWVASLQACGYDVDWRVLCAADYGDPTTRRRLFVQAVRGRRKIVWPEPTHAPAEVVDMFGTRQPWRGADRHVIDWSVPAPSIRGRRISPNTVERINDGLIKYGSPLIIQLTHGGRAVPVARPMPTITTANRGEFGLAYILPQGGGGALRPASAPVPTVACDGAIGLVVKYYKTGIAKPVTLPVDAVTTKPRFGLATATPDDIGYRMFTERELAAAQGFRREFKFVGNKTEIVKQIGNAVPRRLARALCLAVLSQQSNVADLLHEEEAA